MFVIFQLLWRLKNVLVLQINSWTDQMAKTREELKKERDEERQQKNIDSELQKSQSEED